MFANSEYEFPVTENAASGPINGPTINSSDADATTANQAVTYRAIDIYTDLGADSWFEISDDVSIPNLHIQWL